MDFLIADTFTGDLGQRIFQQPFSWKALGVDVRGRSRMLHINYRTSHQIRAQADLLLGPEVSDVDGNKENRRGTISAFNGPEPAVKVLTTIEDENDTVGLWLLERIAEGVKHHEASVFVRSAAELGRARAAVETAGLPYRCSMRIWRPRAAMWRLARCTWPRGWSFAPLS